MKLRPGIGDEPDQRVTPVPPRQDPLPARRDVLGWLACLAVTGLTGHPASAASAFDVEITRDLQALAARARDERLPIVLMVSATDCPFCHRLKKEVLVPLNRSGQYSGRILFREWLIDTWSEHRDFDGATVRALDVARRYSATLTPTLLFLDEHGEEIAKRMVGLVTLEFYGWYLDQAIEKSIAHMASA